MFDPYDLSAEVTPEAIKGALASEDYSLGVVMSLRLNEKDLIIEAMETVPITEGKYNLPGEDASIYGHVIAMRTGILYEASAPLVTRKKPHLPSIVWNEEILISVMMASKIKQNQ